MTRALISKFSENGEKQNKRKDKSMSDVKRLLYRAAMAGFREFTTVIEKTRSLLFKKRLIKEGFIVSIEKSIKFDYLNIKWPKEKKDEKKH